MFAGSIALMRLLRHSVSMAANAANKALCSVAEAAELLNVHPTTALRWAQSGKILAVGKLPGETGSYVLDRDDVERLVAERAVAKAREERATA